MLFRTMTLALTILSLMLYALGTEAETEGGRAMKIKVESTAFTEGGMIPKKYACEGQDLSPPISWSGIPEAAKSIAHIADDPDAPMGTWVHWVVYNLPANITGFLKVSQLRRYFPTAADRGLPISTGLVTAAHALLAGPTDTSSKYTHWIRG